jgi:hypothetical protein
MLLAGFVTRLQPDGQGRWRVFKVRTGAYRKRACDKSDKGLDSLSIGELLSIAVKYVVRGAEDRVIWFVKFVVYLVRTYQGERRCFMSC